MQCSVTRGFEEVVRIPPRIPHEELAPSHLSKKDATTSELGMVSVSQQRMFLEDNKGESELHDHAARVLQ